MNSKQFNKLMDLSLAQTMEIERLRHENQLFRNGFANLSKALEEAPGLPLELLSVEELEHWTDTISGILMALGVLETTGRPMSPFQALIEASSTAAHSSIQEDK